MFTIRIGLLLCGRDGAGWERRSGKGEQDTVGTGKGKGEEGAKEGETRGKGTHSELGYPPSGTRRIGALGDMKCTGKREDERTGERWEFVLVFVRPLRGIGRYRLEYCLTVRVRRSVHQCVRKIIFANGEGIASLQTMGGEDPSFTVRL